MSRFQTNKKKISISLIFLISMILAFMTFPNGKNDAEASIYYTSTNDISNEVMEHGNSNYEIIFTAKAANIPSRISAPAVRKAPLGGGIGKPGPVLAKTRVIDGKRVCKTNNDHPQKSKKNRPGHSGTY